MAAEPRKPARWARVLKWTFGLIGVAFLAVTFAETWHRSQGLPIPASWAFVSAAVLILMGLMCLARAWVGLFSAAHMSRSLSAAFYASQLGRYIPGAIWQVLAQVGLATEAGATAPQASAAFGVFAIVEVAAGGTVGATFAVTGGGSSSALRLAAVTMLIPLLFLQRRWISWALHIAGRILHRTFEDDLVPPQRAILRSYCWTLGTLVVNGFAFAILLRSLTGSASFGRDVSAFGFAWTVGFLAVPFPSGIGIREAVLILTVGSRVPTSFVIAASVSHRLVSMVCEIVMIVASRIGLRIQASRPANAPELDR